MIIFFLSGKNKPFSVWSKKGLQKCFQQTLQEKQTWMLFWKYLQVLTEIKTDVEKVHEQAICGKFNNSSKLGKQTISILEIWQYDRLPWTSTQWHKSDKQKVVSILQIQNWLCRKQKKTKGWSMIMPRGGGTPYIQMIGMIVIFFRGCNQRFGIF